QTLVVRVAHGERHKMNKVPQAAIITAIGHCPVKRTFDTATNGASPYAVRVELGKGRKHALAADGADLATDWFDTGDAIEADRQPGDVQQRLAADSAIGRKQ